MDQGSNWSLVSDVFGAGTMVEDVESSDRRLNGCRTRG